MVAISPQLMSSWVFVFLISTIFGAEWWLYSYNSQEVRGEEYIPKHEEIVLLEKDLLYKQRVVVHLLEELNEKDVKINFLSRKNIKMEKLLGSYKSVLRKERIAKNQSLASEENLREEVSNKYKGEDKKVEQVVRITKKGKETDTKVLIDSDKNEYILSSRHDASQKIDETLLTDIGIIITTAAISGVIVSAIGQPILLGYLLGGSVIGPGCLGLIQQFVQVETLAQLGATFLLFALGVEFSYSNLVRVRKVAVFGGIVQIIGVIVVTIVIGTGFAGLDLVVCAFTGCVLAMSSTTMVVKGLMETNDVNTPWGRVTVGILIMQDLALAIMLTVLPVIAEAGSLKNMILVVGGKLVIMTLILLLCRHIWPLCLRVLQQSKSHDLMLLGVVSLCVVMTMVTDKILGTPEVGAFLSGMLINAAPRESASKALHLFEPVRDIFGALFFSSIGLLINPPFLVQQAYPIGLLVTGVLILKSVCFTPIILKLSDDLGVDLQGSIFSSVALANIGEFAFVLANEGLAFGFLNEKTYKILLGAAAVSLLISPIVTGIVHRILEDPVGKQQQIDEKEKKSDQSSGMHSHAHLSPHPHESTE